MVEAIHVYQRLDFGGSLNEAWIVKRACPVHRILQCLAAGNPVSQVHVPQGTGPAVLVAKGDRRHTVVSKRADDLLEFLIGRRYMQIVFGKNRFVIVDRRNIQLNRQRIGLAVHGVRFCRTGHKFTLQLLTIQDIIERSEQPGLHIRLHKSCRPGNTDVRQLIGCGQYLQLVLILLILQYFLLERDLGMLLLVFLKDLAHQLVLLRRAAGRPEMHDINCDLPGMPFSIFTAAGGIVILSSTAADERKRQRK
ncbi:hypothetical protein D3C73_978720 [compost metagenome]